MMKKLKLLLVLLLFPTFLFSQDGTYVFEVQLNYENDTLVEVLEKDFQLSIDTKSKVALKQVNGGKIKIYDILFCKKVKKTDSYQVILKSKKGAMSRFFISKKNLYIETTSTEFSILKHRSDLSHDLPTKIDKKSIQLLNKKKSK